MFCVVNFVLFAACNGLCFASCILFVVCCVLRAVCVVDFCIVNCHPCASLLYIYAVCCALCIVLCVLCVSDERIS